MTSSCRSNPIGSFGPSFTHDASVPTTEADEEPEEGLNGEEAHREP
jgi:hypothetical protein